MKISRLFFIFSKFPQSYTGWADIKFVGKVKTTDITREYGKKLMITNKEFKEYSKGRSEMSIIEFDNFEKFKTPIKPKNFVTVAGKYIYKNELEMIKNNIT